MERGGWSRGTRRPSKDGRDDAYKALRAGFVCSHFFGEGDDVTWVLLLKEGSSCYGFLQASRWGFGVKLVPRVKRTQSALSSGGFQETIQYEERPDNPCADI